MFQKIRHLLAYYALRQWTLRKGLLFGLCLLMPVLACAESLDSVAAIVNDGVITASEVDTQVEQLKKQLMAKGVQVPPEKVLRKQVLQHLVDVALQLQIAKQNNITIDSTELNETINRIAESNKLTLSELRNALSQQGFDWKAYRENIRKEVLIARIQQKALNKDITVSNEQIDDYLKSGLHKDNSQYTYHLQNIVIPLPEDPTSDQVAQAKAKADSLLTKIARGADFSQLAIEESSGEFALEGGDLGERHLAEMPEIFAKIVVNMKKGQVSDPVRAGNGFQLIKLVDIGGDNIRHEVTKTHVRHILLKPDASTTAEQAKIQVNNIYQQLKSGKDFAELAKHYSLDGATAVKGGDLGWVSGGELVPAFEKAMDKLALNEISKPVKSPFGWHIIQVLERKVADDTVGYEREQVRKFLQQRKFAELVENWLQHLRTEAYVKMMNEDVA